MANTVGNMFTGTLSPKDLTAYTLMRGVTDFSNLVQFNNFETGYSFLIDKLIEFIKRFTEIIILHLN